MESSVLYSITDSFDVEQIPTVWKNIDFNTFSEGKKLYPYQREALENALKILYKFYQNNGKKEIEALKKDFLKLAEHNGLAKEQQEKYFAYTNQESKAYEILSEYFEEDTNQLPAFHFINRMSFWMATGSGKSIVLIKLIELLQDLMKNETIPQNEILFLTHRTDLIDQLKTHIIEFNQYTKREKGIEFIVRDLKEFPEQKIQGNLFKDTQINIYFYRSDLVSDIQKENIIDFKNYDNDGKWYVILDEAHKGDSEESKRKQYFNILSRNGFLFNFSATFTDEIDILSTVYNLNLAEYIKKGFGKHLYLFQEQFKNFKKTVDEKDFEQEEKQKIVLMSIILLAFIKKQAHTLRKGINAYHNPLLLTLVNSVSAEDSDLYLFFNELKKIATNKFSKKLFEESKKILQNDLYNNQLTEFEKSEVLSNVEISSIKDITIEDVWHYVFNTKSSGEFEVKRNPRNNQELSFRVKSGAHSEPFALIKIGDVKEFEKNNLGSYDIEEDFDDESLFENLDNSSVNILMGSRAFYEGWDSNRPNIINFVNIGTQSEAKKFILQSIGRGIRIEPIKNNRKRLLPLINDGIEIEENLSKKSKDIKPLETLFVFGTNQKAILSVLETLKGEQPEEEHQLSLFDKFIHNHSLFVPTYKTVKENNQRKLKKLKIHEDDFAVFDDVMKTMDKTALAMNYNLAYNDVSILTDKHKEAGNFKTTEEEKIGKTEPVVKHILNYYKIVPEEVDSFSMVQEEIVHYNHIKVKTSATGSATSIEFKRLDELKQKIEKAKNPVNVEAKEAELDNLLEKKKITLKEYKEEIKKLAGYSETGIEAFSHRNEDIEIKKLLNHYYFPSIVSKKDRIKWMKHIVDTPSEVSFLKALEKHLKTKENFFTEFDWWMFSKVDHTLDKQIRIPYIDPANGKRDFLPDFVFWLQKGKDYHILYIDPKGTGRSEYQYKVDGYRDLFEDSDKLKTFKFSGKNFKVHLRLATEDTAVFADKDYYKKYWVEPDVFNIKLDE